MWAAAARSTPVEMQLGVDGHKFSCLPAVIPMFEGLGAPPKLNTAPRTAKFTLLSIISLQDGSYLRLRSNHLVKTLKSDHLGVCKPRQGAVGGLKQDGKARVYMPAARNSPRGNTLTARCAASRAHIWNVAALHCAVMSLAGALVNRAGCALMRRFRI